MAHQAAQAPSLIVENYLDIHTDALFHAYFQAARLQLRLHVILYCRLSLELIFARAKGREEVQWSG